MLLRNLQDRSTGQRISGGVSGGGDGGGARGENENGVDGEGNAPPASSSSPGPSTPTSPRPPLPSRLASSLAASADLAPRLRVVATCDGHVGCVNAVSFAGESAERLVTGGDDMTVRIWASDVSAWEGGAPGTSTTAAALPSRRELARIRTQHRSNVFQAFFVDAADEGSDLLTCAADGTVRALSVPRAQCDRLFKRSSGGVDGSTARGRGGPTAVVESRCLFRHCGRAHKMALVPGSPHEFATCGEDGVVVTFDLRERGRGGGGGGGGGGGRGRGRGSAAAAAAAPSPLTAAVGPGALAAAARVPGRSCFPPSDRGCSRAGAPAASSNADVTLYSVSFDPLRPWLLAVGGEANDVGLGEFPAAVVIDRRMLSVPPSDAFHRFDDGGGDDNRGDGGESRPDPAAGTIFARGSLFREFLESNFAARRMALSTLDEARLPSRCAAVVQGSALPAHLGTFRARASRSARRHARFRARGASVTGVAFEPRGRGSLLVTVNAESAVYLVPAAIARGEACAGDAGEDADSDAAGGVGGGGGGGGGRGSSSESEESSSSSEQSSDEEGRETERDRRRRRRRQQQRERERELQRRQRQQQRGRDPAPPPCPREPRPSHSYFHRREYDDDNEHADPDGCRRFSGSGYKNEATIKAAGFVGAESELVAAGSDGGRLFLFDARSSRPRARVSTDAHTCNAFREHPFAPLHLATVGIDDSAKLLAPVGERRRGGGRRERGGGSGGGGAAAAEEEGEDVSEEEQELEESEEEGEEEQGEEDEEEEEEEEEEGEEGEDEEEELAVRLSAEGLDTRRLRLMMRLAAMGVPLPTRMVSLPARDEVGEEEGGGGREEEEEEDGEEE